LKACIAEAACDARVRDGRRSQGMVGLGEYRDAKLFARRRRSRTW
jgi:hypothetical protein